MLSGVVDYANVLNFLFGKSREHLSFFLIIFVMIVIPFLRYYSFINFNERINKLIFALVIYFFIRFILDLSYIKHLEDYGIALDGLSKGLSYLFYFLFFYLLAMRGVKEITNFLILFSFILSLIIILQYLFPDYLISVASSKNSLRLDNFSDFTRYQINADAICQIGFIFSVSKVIILGKDYNLAKSKYYLIIFITSIPSFLSGRRASMGAEIIFLLLFFIYSLMRLRINFALISFLFMIVLFVLLGDMISFIYEPFKRFFISVNLAQDPNLIWRELEATIGIKELLNSGVLTIFWGEGYIHPFTFDGFIIYYLHNGYIGILYNYGIIGALFYISLLIMFLLKILKLLKKLKNTDLKFEFAIVSAVLVYYPILLSLNYSQNIFNRNSAPLFSFIILLSIIIFLDVRIGDKIDNCNLKANNKNSCKFF